MTFKRVLKFLTVWQQKKRVRKKAKQREGKPGDNTPHNIYDRLFREK